MRYSSNADMNTFVSGFKLLTGVGTLPNNQIPVEYNLLQYLVRSESDKQSCLHHMFKLCTSTFH